MSDPRTVWDGRGSDDRKGVAVAYGRRKHRHPELLARLPHSRPCWCRECINVYAMLKDRKNKGHPLDGLLAESRSCESCGYSFTPPGCARKTGRFCSKECRWFALGNGTPPGSSRIYWPRCYECGGVFGPYKERKSKWLCDVCRPVARARAAKDINRRKNSKRRRAALGEKYSFRQIAERDGWRCHLCGKKVPDRPHEGRPLDGEIDHLVPVSAGGVDDPSNVALAHRRCNLARGARGAAQLRLIG